jgi:hypothetical protein
LDAAQDLRGPVAQGEAAVHEVRSGQVDHRLIDGLALVIEQVRCVVAEEFFEVAGLQSLHGVAR